VRYESPLFILSAEEAKARYLDSKKQMARFYKKLRQDKKIMLNDDETPWGDKWSFDEDNRKKLPKNIKLPTDISFYTNSEITEAQTWLKSVPGEHYGESNVWLPYTHSEARAWLDSFLAERFENFGDYEDALADTHTRLFHSTISPLLNIGLITPLEVIDAAIKYSRTKEVSLNNLEGFVRQIIGWREFIRASYETEGSSMRTKNFWQHNRKLPSTFWDGSTGIFPIDIAIKNSLKYGYGHHIERLMVMGNFMLLTKTKPDEVYRWFMAMYVDAYDWVMVPNVYGMSQFADGGSFATKPYISGSNYLKKMSDYPAGDWEEIWTSLYWKFIADNSEFFKSNHRLSMMPRLLEKMEPSKKLYYKKTAEDYLSKDV
jgi:deoxyribodipyrimidine photolyase-related protein